MRALIYDGSEPRLVTGCPEPKPGAGEAVIRPLRVGVGATEVAICRGLFSFSGVLGQEFVGVVESAPAGFERLAGRRVVGAAHASCGACELCKRGLPDHCRQQTALGRRGRDGCLADRFVLPAVNLVVVPDSVDDERAIFAQPVAAALHAARRLTIEGKPYITVLGDGVLGLLSAQVMSRLNASVRLIGRHSAKLARCERWSVKHRHIDEIGRRADQDVVVECTGTVDGLRLAMQLVRPRGTIVLKSLAVPPANDGRVDLSPLVVNEIALIGSIGGPVAEAIGLIERGEIDVVSLLGKRMRLDDGPAVLHAAAEPGALKVVVEIR